MYRMQDASAGLIQIRRLPMFAGRSLTKQFPFIRRRQPTDTPDRAVRRPVRRRLTLAVAGLAMLLGLLLVPAVSVSAAATYPPNTVISTYSDARYGVVSVVTDAYGNLIDVNAATGQRIYPIYADYAPGVAYTNGVYTNGVYTPVPYANGYYYGYYAPNA
jgi:hypothetical protein